MRRVRGIRVDKSGQKGILSIETDRADSPTSRLLLPGETPKSVLNGITAYAARAA